jgi:acyl-CoA reductase-like NAD-dependent aldehyde dehydrogenase
VAENAAEIDAIAKRAAKTIASLPPRERERANERITDIIAEKPE